MHVNTKLFTQPSLPFHQILESPLSDTPQYSWPANFAGPSHKKRKVERACDACRRRKTRCDGPQTANNVCSNCVQARRTCTYQEASKPRGPPKAYVTGLENRLEKMEALLKRLRPEVDFSPELGPPVVRDSWRTDDTSQPATDLSRPRRLHLAPPLPYTYLSFAFPRTRRIFSMGLTDAEEGSDASNGYSTSENEDIYKTNIQNSMKRLNLHDMRPLEKGDRSLDGQMRFHGSSSPFRLAAALRQLKRERLNEMRLAAGLPPEDESPRELPEHELPQNSSLRVSFWKTPIWELEWEGVHITSPSSFPSLRKSFPPPDLATALIDLYFNQCESIFRLLHRPTFERQFADRLYIRDVWFACVCMCVFAMASRYTDDERVLLPESSDVPPDEEMARLRWQKAGFVYYFAAMDVILHKRSLMAPAGLFEMQAACLTSAFTRDTHWHPNSWIVIGVGARKIQDVGAHRKQVYGATPSVEDELWRRAFWCLVAWDRISSVMLGRACIIRGEDFDTPYPLEVDDEYWENDDPVLAFKQPPEIPSALTAYVFWLKITDIVAFSMRTLYAVDKWKSRMGLKDPQRPEEILKQLNAALTQWATAVPEYLRWTPNIEDPSVANQSATMYIAFNLLQISIHRSFLPQSASRLRALGAPTQQFSVDRKALTHLAIAVNSAKSITHIGEEIRRRSLANVTVLMTASEICSAVLCLNVWIIKAREKARRAKGFEPDLAAANTIDALMEDINSLVAGLEWAAQRWERADEALSYLKSALPGAINEPTDLDGIQLEIMASAEFDYHSDMQATPPPDPWNNVRHYGRTEDQFSMASSSMAQASPPDDSIVLQNNLETLPLDKLTGFLRPHNPRNQKDHKPLDFAPPTGDHRAMPPPPLPTHAPAAQWYNSVAPTPRPYPSPSFSPPFTTNSIAPPESPSNSLSAEHLSPFDPSSSHGPYVKREDGDMSTVFFTRSGSRHSVSSLTDSLGVPPFISSSSHGSSYGSTYQCDSTQSLQHSSQESGSHFAYPHTYNMSQSDEDTRHHGCSG